MAVYKVPQDVEAEDKLLGPLTIKQFVYAIVVFISGWLTVVVAQNPLTLIFLPLTLTPALFFGFLIFLGIKNSAQPAESYLAAIVRFYFKPRKRIWSQEGVIERVQVTAPKTETKQYTDNLSQTEVTSRLKSLANIMDSRGWAAKDPRFQANIILPTAPSSDRLLDINQLPAMTQQSDASAQQDIMDESVSPLAAQFDSMIAKTDAAHRQQAVDHMNDPSYNPYPDMHQHVIDPTGTKPKKSRAKSNPKAAPKMENEKSEMKNEPPAPAPDPAITHLVDNAGDLSVQTLAGEAQRLKSLESGEEISLH